MTKFTRDTAFNVTFHQYIIPMRLIIIIPTVNITVNAENNDCPVSIYVTTNTTTRDIAKDSMVSIQIVRYCS